MNAADSPILGAPELAALLAKTPFAAALRTGAPLLVATVDPPGILFASDSVLSLFHARNLDEFAAAAVIGSSPGATRLRQLGRTLAAGAPLRLELLRFFAGRKPLMVAFACARFNGWAKGPVIVATIAGAATASTPVEEKVEAADAAPAAIATQRAPSLGASAPQGERFLWSVDQEGRFGAPAQALIETLGADAPRQGESLHALKARTGLDADGRLEAAFAALTTFAALRVNWPLAASGTVTAVLLSGAPILDRERRRIGFRGFGHLTGETIVVDRNKEVHTPDLAPCASPSHASHGDKTIAGQAEEPAVAPIAAEASSMQAASPAAPLAQTSSEGARDELAESGAQIVPLRPPGLPLAGAQNVVPIRPDLRAFAPLEEPRRGEGEASVELTPNERSAFREIARALGAKVRAEDPTAPEEAGEDEASPKSSAAVGAIGELDAASLIDRLPIGALVARGDDALYLNRTLLDLLGYADIDEFRAESGLSHMFGEHGAERLAPAAKPIALTAAEGQTIMVDGLAQTIEWRGAPATLFSFRRSYVAEMGPRIGALEQGARARTMEASELSAILQAAADGVVVFDRDGEILSLNRAAEALFGVSQRDVAGEDFATLFEPEAREAARNYFDWLRATGLAGLGQDGREILGLKRNGGPVPLFVKMARVGLPPDVKFCAILRDMTHWKKIEGDREDARRQAERASALKSEFLAKISHEIRTPLNAILGFAEVIMEERFGPIGNERYKDYVKDIHASGGHVMSLVNDLLDLSKIEAGKLDLQFAPIDANLIIQECVALMQPQAANERVIMRLSLAERLPRVVADERSLRQIMLNLMSNAVKFNEPGGQVIVSTGMNDSGQAVIRVRDTGVGMSEGEIATALEPFRQVATTRRPGGTGLGLPLTKALTEANRAAFSIKSRKEQGTLVELAFPTTPAAAAQ
jgi:PAS domain S-box-containing protein